MNTGGKMIINKMIMYEMGTYNSLAIRPYQSHLDMDSIKHFNELTHGGTNLTTTNLSGIAGSIIRPSGQSIGEVSMSNGWDTPRFAFMMQVELEIMGVKSHQVLTGYTDHVGFSYHSESFDPNMILHFNTSILLRSHMMSGANGRYQQTTVQNASHILTGIPTKDRNVYGGTQGASPTVSMRPEDVFSRIGTPMIMESSYADAIDTRVDFSLGAKKSRRSNASAPQYLSSVLTAHTTAQRQSDISYDDDSEIAGRAKGMVKEDTFAADSFLNSFSQNGTIREGATLAWSELTYTNPHVSDLCVVVRRRAGAPVHQAGSTEGWHGSTIETIAATIISHAVPALMLDLMLTTVHFTATNSTIDGQYAISINHVETFASGIDPTPYVQRFIDKVRYELLDDISKRNQMSFSIDVKCDAIGESFIRVSLNGQPEIDYMMPSFCDALSAPVIAGGIDNLITVASDLNSLTSNLDYTAGSTDISSLIASGV